MYHAARSVYRLVNEHVFARMAPSSQIAIKRALLGVCRRVFPGLLPDDVAAEQLVRSRPRKEVPLLLPDWAKREMEELAIEVDPSLHPARFTSNNPVTYVVPFDRALAGEVYQQLLSQLTSRFDAVLLVPWIKHGGADLGVLHHAKALTEIFGLRTLVIATEPQPSPWASRLPAGVQFLDAGPFLARLYHSPADANAVLARLMIQFAPRTIHVIGSRHGWEMIRLHGQAVRQSSGIFASLYCDDFDLNGCRDGYAVRYLQQTYRWLSGIITDNSASPRTWTEQLGIPSELFHVVPFPAPDQRIRERTAVAGKRLLWAGRLDKQKRPDVLARIAELLPEFDWDVHGSGVVPGHAADVSGLSGATNVSMHGRYERFAEIVRDDHLAFVYTSQWDGLPNVLLEAAASGLPIVAPDIGGIRDLIPAERLIAPFDDAAAYAQRIRELASSSHLRTEYVERQWQALSGRSWSSFASAMAQVRGYGQCMDKPREACNL
jgi:glycosyltransferase involved in cell wall biosynthesis